YGTEPHLMLVLHLTHYTRRAAYVGCPCAGGRISRWPRPRWPCRRAARARSHPPPHPPSQPGRRSGTCPAWWTWPARADGSFLVAAAGQLFVLGHDRTLRPFARGAGGYRTATGTEPYLTLAGGRQERGNPCSFGIDTAFALEPGSRPGVIMIRMAGRGGTARPRETGGGPGPRRPGARRSGRRRAGRCARRGGRAWSPPTGSAATGSGDGPGAGTRARRARSGSRRRWRRRA